MNLAEPSPLIIPLQVDDVSFGFQGYEIIQGDKRTVFGTYDSFGSAADDIQKSLDYSKRDLYGLLVERLGIKEFFSLNQIHSIHIAEVSSKPTSNQGFLSLGEGDGIVSGKDQTGLTIRTADCTPVFAWNHDKIGIFHVGYRGLIDGILEQIKTHLDPKKQAGFAIGPHIGPCCLQVYGGILEEIEAGDSYLQGGFSIHHDASPDKKPFSMLAAIRQWHSQSPYAGGFSLTSRPVPAVI